MMTNNIYTTKHSRKRIKERIGVISKDDKLELAQEAYIKGANPVTFYEKDLSMFKLLRYLQSKFPKRTLRLYEGNIYIFSLTPPHALITTYPLSGSLNKYKERINYETY